MVSYRKHFTQNVRIDRPEAGIDRVRVSNQALIQLRQAGASLPLKAVSIVYYLSSLLPVRLMEDTPFAIIAEPASPSRVLATLLAVALVSLAFSALAVRRKEVNYGGEQI